MPSVMTSMVVSVMMAMMVTDVVITSPVVASAMVRFVMMMTGTAYQGHGKRYDGKFLHIRLLYHILIYVVKQK